MNDKLKRVFSCASQGDLGALTVEIYVGQDRALTNEEERSVSAAGMKLHDGFLLETKRQDPAYQKLREEWFVKSRECFEAAGLFPIFVEETKNEYCSCCPHNPWLIVTTPIGHVKCGWRKRVIEIDYARTTVKLDARTLFAAEDVTKEDKLIHAWSYEKMTEYLTALRVQATTEAGR